MAPKRSKKIGEDDSPPPDDSGSRGTTTTPSIDIASLGDQQALKDYILTKYGGQQALGNESGPVLRHFGHLGEGYTGGVTEAQRDILRRRYHVRRDHADYARYPEGYEFLHDVGDGVQRVVILLTPPFMVAVCEGNGNWHRTRRAAQDGPEPYSQRWYENYLRTHRLPSWWMSMEHIAMLFHDDEASFLKTTSGPARTLLPPQGYLDLRYPERPQYPRPNLHGSGQHYAYELVADEQLRLSRRFPGTVANSMLSDPGFSIFVIPEGFIVIRDRELDPTELRVPSGATEWLDDEEMQMLANGKIIASYRVETGGTGLFLPRRPRIEIPFDRQGTIDAIIQNGTEFINLPQVPHGLGRFRFLDDVADRLHAQQLGLNDEFAVTEARQNGLLNVGTGTNAAPTVVHTPDPRYFNPMRRPAGNGAFEYYTDLGDGSSQALAWLNFGGQDYFPNNQQPSAEDIWELRREFQARIRAGEDVEDITQDINIVWEPSEEDTPPAGTTTTGPRPPREPTVTSGSSGPIDDPNVDSITGVRHDPTNGGRNNQTGASDTAFYQSRRLTTGQTQTVDRSRAHAGVIEPHKSWMATKKGQWQQWSGYKTIDWNDKDNVEKMNKWREQAATRNEWPKKRATPRQDYTQEQRKWLFDLVAEAGGNRPSKEMKDIAREFNKRFRQKRDHNGILSVIDRLRKEYEEYGRMKEHKTRGHNKTKEKEDRKKRGDTPSDITDED